VLLRSQSVNTLPRILASLRRYAPAAPLALSVTVGQGAVWLLPPYGVVGLLVVLGIILILRLHPICRRYTRGISWIVVGVVLGVFSAAISLAGRSSEAPLTGDLNLLVEVSQSPRHPRPGEISFEVAVNPVSPASNRDALAVRCRAIDLPWRNATQLALGDIVWLSAKFTPVVKPLNPFSWQGWLWRNGITSECEARFVSIPLNRKDEHSISVSISQVGVVHYLRDALRRLVLRSFDDSEGAGLFLSMTLGYHDLISVPLERAFTRLGLTHLLVVSGYQVSLVFGVVLALVTAISSVTLGGISFSGRLVRGLVIGSAMVISGVYVVFIGLEMSAIRALIAAACVCARLISERDTSFMQRWGVALLAMQLLWPWCAFDIGVVLTFAALFGIGIGSELAKSFSIPSFFAVTVAVWLTTTLVIVIWQGAISPLGLLVNLLVAAPWSVVNCTVGLCALGLFYTGLPWAQYPLSCVVWLNYTISRGILLLGESLFAGWQLEGEKRVFAILALWAVLGVLVRRLIFTRRIELAQ
jgi:ComEC/Rec2-related protein